VGVVVLLPSRATSASLLTRLPFIRHFDERGLSDLAVLRDGRTRVVLVTAEPIDPWILERELVGLAEGDEDAARDMRRRLVCVVMSPGGATTVADAVLADLGAVDRLRHELRGTASGLLVNSDASEACDRLGEMLGVAVEQSPASLSAQWATKSGSKTLFREAGVPCARGGPEVVRGVADTMRAVRQLAAAAPGVERVIVKLDAAGFGAGVGNALVRVDALLRGGDLGGAVESMQQPWESYARELAAGGAIVEEFFPDLSSSPSAQGHIAADGSFELLAVHDQILASGEYRGCTFPVEPAVAAAAGEAIARIGQRLARHGVRGSFGVDFAVVDGQTYALEINVRKVGPSHVIKAVRALTATPGAYVHRRLRYPELFTALAPRTVIETLDRERLLYDRATRTGIILHVMGALHRYGYVETTALAPSPAEAQRLDERCEAALVAAASG
jgi:hypothetical protein